MSEGAVDIEVHREAVLRRWLESPRHSWLGVHVDAMRGREQAEEIPRERPRGEGNRAQRRRAQAKARRRA